MPLLNSRGRAFWRTLSVIAILLYLSSTAVQTRANNPVTDITTGNTYATIQAAVTAANPNDVLSVSAGIYAENVTVNKPLTIRGANVGINPNTGARAAESIVIPAVADPTDDNSIFQVTADNVTIDGFTLDGHNGVLNGGNVINGVTSFVGYAVANVNSSKALANVNNLIVRNNIIQNINYSGIWLSSDNTAAPKGNLLTANKFDNMNGVDPISGDTRSGIRLTADGYADITNNVMTRTGFGIETTTFGTNSHGQADTISGNRIDGDAAAVFLNNHYGAADNFAVIGNTLSSAAGGTGARIWSIQGTPTVTLTNNIITSGTYGYRFWNVITPNTVTVSGGTVSGVSIGVRLYTCTSFGTPLSDQAVKIDGVTINGATTVALQVYDNNSTCTSNKITDTKNNSKLIVESATTAVGGLNGAAINRDAGGTGTATITLDAVQISGMTGAAVALSDPNGVASDTVTIQNKTNLSGNQDGIDLTVPGTITVNTTDIDNNTSAAIRQTAGTLTGTADTISFNQTNAINQAGGTFNLSGSCLFQNAAAGSVVTSGSALNSNYWGGVAGPNLGAADKLSGVTPSSFHSRPIVAGIVTTAPCQSYLGEYVFADNNRSGLKTGNPNFSTPITVTLLQGGASQGSTPTLTVPAGSLEGLSGPGYYDFAGLTNNSTYQIQFAAPGGYIFSPQRVGSNNAINSAPDASGKTANVTVTTGLIDATENAGLQTAPTPTFTNTASPTSTPTSTPTTTTTSTVTVTTTATTTSTSTGTLNTSTATTTATSTLTGTLNTSTATSTITGTLPTSTTAPTVSGATPTGQINVADPVLTKFADVQLAQPGTAVHFTLTVTNVGTGAASGVVVTDTLPGLLSLQSATASQGTFTLNTATNVVLFNIGTVSVGQVITLGVDAVVSRNATPPQMVTNSAALNDSQGDTRSASATVRITAGFLPSTGEHPAESTGLVVPLLIALLGFGGLFSARKWLSGKPREIS